MGPEGRDGRLEARPAFAGEKPAVPGPHGPPPALSPHELIRSCQGLVRSLAWKIHRKLPPQVDLEDLIGFGQVGLAEAARDFDPARGNKFSTFAHHRIRGSILDGLSRLSWFRIHDYHASRYETLASDVLRLEDADAAQAGEGWRGAEGAESPLQNGVRWLRGVARKLAVLQLASGLGASGVGGEEGRPDGVVVADERSPSPVEEALEKEMRERLHRLIAALPADAGSLIRGVYFEGLTLQAAGERIGISKAWASRLHQKTLGRLAHALKLLGMDG